MSAASRARFAELHAREGIFVMPNPWDSGSAKLLEAVGAEALATTSAGLRVDARPASTGGSRATSWSLTSAPDGVGRRCPLNVDSERCFPDDEGGVAETVRLLGAPGAAGCSIEDWNPGDGADRRARARGRTRRRGRRGGGRRPTGRSCSPACREPPARRRRPRRHDRAAPRLPRRGADCLYAPWLLTRLEQIAAVVEAVGAPVNVLAAACGSLGARARQGGVRRRLDGSLLASAAPLLRGAPSCSRTGPPSTPGRR